MTDNPEFWDLIAPVAEQMTDDLPRWTPTQVLVWIATDTYVMELLTEVAARGPAPLVDYLDVLGPYLSEANPDELALITPPEETS